MTEKKDEQKQTEKDKGTTYTVEGGATYNKDKKTLTGPDGKVYGEFL